MLALCLALAAGEAVGAAAPGFAATWPVVMFAFAAVALAGYGLSLPLWRYAAVFLLGLLAFFASEAERGEAHRFSPWLRNAAVRERMRRRPLPPAAEAARRDLSRRIGIGLSRQPEVVRINRAILLGERSALPAATRSAFVRAGTIHVFAISGLHVMIVADVLSWLFTLAAVPRRVAGAVSLVPLWAYVYLVGSPPSAVRAASMASLYLAAPLFRRRPNGLVAWAVTFAAVHLASPASIADVGCRLSFAVTLSIVAACRIVGQSAPEWRKRLAIALATWAAGIPIAAQAFGTITPGGLLANLVLIPAADITVRAGVVGALASYASETLAAHLNNVAALMTSAMAGVSGAVASLPFSNFEIRAWTWSECAAYYAALAAAALWLRRARSRRCI